MVRVASCPVPEVTRILKSRSAGPTLKFSTGWPGLVINGPLDTGDEFDRNPSPRHGR
jgi:hypothetical protein